MRGEARLRLCRRRFVGALTQYDANRTPPVVENIEDVALAELDAHRTPAPAACLQALAVAIDAPVGDGQRNTLLRPAENLLECRSGDAHEMAAVLSTEIRLELPAIVGKIRHRHVRGACPGGAFPDQAQPLNVRSGSTR